MYRSDCLPAVAAYARGMVIRIEADGAAVTIRGAEVEHCGELVRIRIDGEVVFERPLN